MPRAMLPKAPILRQDLGLLPTRLAEKRGGEVADPPSPGAGGGVGNHVTSSSLATIGYTWTYTPLEVIWPRLNGMAVPITDSS